MTGGEINTCFYANAHLQPIITISLPQKHLGLFYWILSRSMWWLPKNFQVILIMFELWIYNSSLFRFGDCQVEVTIGDENDNSPRFTNLPNETSVSEGASVNTVFYTVQVKIFTLSSTDPDTFVTIIFVFDVDEEKNGDDIYGSGDNTDVDSDVTLEMIVTIWLVLSSHVTWILFRDWSHPRVPSPCYWWQ